MQAAQSGIDLASSIAEPDLLPSLQAELVRPGLRRRFADPGLEQRYQREQFESARLHNRIALVALVIVFDAFIIPELTALPEIVRASAMMRFGLLTPAVLLFLLIDWRGFAPRWTVAMVTALLMAPTLIACALSLWVTSSRELANFQVIPLIQLTTMACRVSLRQVMVINLCATGVFVWMALASSFIPHAVAPTMVLTDVGICVCTLVFAWRLDQRDRQVFLFTHQAVIGRDMLAAQNRTLARLTQIDALTGLGNRRCFDERMAALWAERPPRPSPVTLIMFDIDCFKQFNDALGHQAGDECLAAVARAVSRCLRDERDTLVRYGGEEFAVILPGTQLEEGTTVAERVRQAVQDRALHHPGGGPSHLVTVSLGVAAMLPSAHTAASLIEAADRCLYAAKRRGRNCVQVAQPESKAALLF